jgi:hypothetical protein
MRSAREICSFAAGLIAIAAFGSVAPAASDPPAKARQEQHGHSSAAPHAAPGGRWHTSSAAEPHASAHGNEAAHGDGHGPEIGFRGCAYFEGANFAGRRGEIREGAAVEWLGRAWSDRISSSACHPGCRLIGYADINYGGPRRNLTGAIADLGHDWNDRISALRAICDGAAQAEAH